MANTTVRAADSSLSEIISPIWAYIQLHIWSITATVVLAQLVKTRYRAGLRHIPGPLIASFSNGWKLQAVWKRNMHRENIRVHEDYGPIVRIGPNHVSLADPKSMRLIYGVQNVFRKVCPFYTTHQVVVQLIMNRESNVAPVPILRPRGGPLPWSFFADAFYNREQRVPHASEARIRQGLLHGDDGWIGALCR